MSCGRPGTYAYTNGYGKDWAVIFEWRYVGGEADHFFKMGRGQTVPLLQALKKHEEDAFRNILNA